MNPGARDPRQIETLIASGVILSGLALADLVHPRFRFLAFGACGLLAASALTGFSPLSRFMERDEREEPDERDEELPAPRTAGLPAIARLGVPHRIPDEVGLARPRRADADERPAPSPEGELGLSD